MANAARHNAAFRALPCGIILGVVNVIYSDKTGTLTKNEMTAVAVRTGVSHYNVSGIRYDPSTGKVYPGTEKTDDVVDLSTTSRELETLAIGALLCNDSSIALDNVQDKFTKQTREKIVPVGDPTKVSLVTLGEKLGMRTSTLRQQNKRLATVPFESEHKFMCTIHKSDKEAQGTYIIYVKGAPDRLIPLCNQQLIKINDDNTEVDSSMDADAWQNDCFNYALQGLRTLAI